MCQSNFKSYIQALNNDAIIEHEPRQVRLFQASLNNREDLKISFKSNNDLKLSVSFTICNPAHQHSGIVTTLNCVIEREQNKSSKLITDIKKIDSGCSCQLYMNKMIEVQAKYHSDNLDNGFSSYPFVVYSSGNRGYIERNHR